mmetsp:Transcript_4319/g.15496  ORF Transcript_4319/g.15496 Transcript_4319/m.15496 type:complete len:455 (+) Transcript_4319:277-1641(+)
MVGHATTTTTTTTRMLADRLSCSGAGASRSRVALPRQRASVAPWSTRHRRGPTYSVVATRALTELPSQGSGLPEWDKDKRDAEAGAVQQDEAFTLGWPRTLHECYELGEEIGRGSFGVVRKARERWPVQFTSVNAHARVANAGSDLLEDQRFAVKSIPKRPKRRTRRKRFVQGDEEVKRNQERLVRRQREKLLGEVAFMVALDDCPHSAQLVGAYEDKTHAHLVVELCSGGDLKRLLRKRGTLTEREAGEITETALSFISHCHRKGFVFSDVKPANFMLKFKLDEETNAEDSSHPLVVKGIDFGCSQRLGDPEEHNMLTKRTGTPAYWAPEVFMRYYNHQADVWSCGMMLYEMLVGKLPFWDDIESCTPKQVHKGVMRGKVSFAGKARQYDVYDSLDGSQSLDSWDAEECDAEGNCGISPEAQDLILRMLDKNPASRITAEQALEHPWVKRWRH